MKKIFKPPLWAILMALLFLQTKVKAQEDEKEQKIKRYEWEIGVNPIPLFGSFSEPYISIPTMMLRKHQEQIKKSTLIKSAYRLRLGLYTNTNKVDSAGFNPNQPSAIKLVSYSALFLYLQIGKEWQKQIGKFQLLYGIDFAYQIEHRKDRLLQINFVDVYRTGLQPFIGVKYFMNSRFSISYEAAMVIFYTRSYGKSKQLDYADLSMFLSPFNAINFSYYFN